MQCRGIFFLGWMIGLCFLSISSDCCFSDHRDRDSVRDGDEEEEGVRWGEVNKPNGSSSSTKDIYCACWSSEGFRSNVQG